MKTPKNLQSFLEANKRTTFYYVSLFAGHGAIIPVFPRAVFYDQIAWSDPESPTARVIHPFSCIYEDRGEAERYVKKYRDICDRFVKKPQISDTVAFQYADKLLAAEKAISLALSGRSNFIGTAFIEDFEGNVDIRPLHKDFPNGYFGVRSQIKNDFSNLDDAVAFAISQFQFNDTPEYISSFKSFLRTGEQIGWD